jgi:hypothetical protein
MIQIEMWLNLQVPNGEIDTQLKSSALADDSTVVDVKKILNLLRSVKQL